MYRNCSHSSLKRIPSRSCGPLFPHFSLCFFRHRSFHLLFFFSFLLFLSFFYFFIPCICTDVQAPAYLKRTWLFFKLILSKSKLFEQWAGSASSAQQFRWGSLVHDGRSSITIHCVIVTWARCVVWSGVLRCCRRSGTFTFTFTSLVLKWWSMMTPQLARDWPWYSSFACLPYQLPVALVKHMSWVVDPHARKQLWRSDPMSREQKEYGRRILI